MKPGPETMPLAGIADRFTDPGGRPLLVASNWIEPTPGQHWQRHHHPDHELLWGVDGTVVADVGGERFTVPPRQALWIPNGRDHEVHNVSASQIICTWLSSEYVAWSGHEAVAFGMSTLLREVLTHLRISGRLTTEDLVRRRRAELFALDLLDGELETAWSVPLPDSPHLVQLADAIRRDPGHDWSMAAAAHQAGISERTLRRQFIAETGMGFAQWRRHQRIHAAVALLLDGATIATTARRLGYRSSSAFTHAYREVIGMTPAEHVRRIRSQTGRFPSNDVPSATPQTRIGRSHMK